MYDVRVTLVIVLLYAYILSSARHDLQKNRVGDIAAESHEPLRQDVNSSTLENESGELKDASTDNVVLTDK
jgi:hypothetical protein